MMPRVSILTQYEQDSPVLLSVIDRLLAHKVLFTGFLENQVPSRFSDELLQGRLLLIDKASLLGLTPEQRRKVEDYSRSHQVECFDYVGNPDDRQSLNLSAEITVNGALSEGDVGQDGDDMPEQDAAATLRFIAERSERYLSQPKIGFNEFTVHALRGLQHSEPERFRATLVKLLDSQDDNVIPGNHDQLGAWMYAPLCSRITGDSRYVESFLKVLRRTMAVRPYTPEGFMAGSGNVNDPLNMEGEFPGYSPLCIGRERVVYNEMFHFHGPVFAVAYRATGDTAYLDQALQLLWHLRDVNTDADGLPFHYSIHGKAAGSKWGRGATHILHGITLMLELWPNIPQRDDIIAYMDRMGRGLLATQAPDGAWHNVLDNPCTPLEMSCTCGIISAFKLCIRNGWLPADRYQDMLARARHALLQRCWRGGFAENCSGTGLSPYPEYYVRRPFNFLFTGQLAAALSDN